MAQCSTATWSGLGAGITGGFAPAVNSVLVLDSGDIVAGGFFSSAGGVAANNLAVWDGTAWSQWGPGIIGSVSAMVTMPNGELVVGGGIQLAGLIFSPGNIVRWTAGGWATLGTGLNGQVVALRVLPGGDLVACGNFTTAGGVSANGVARWNGTTWSALGSGVNGNVTSLTVRPNGDVIVAGGFTSAGGVPAGRIAQWDGSVWSPLGSGMDAIVRCVTSLSNGDVIAGGDFTTAGGVPATHVARWDGNSWAPMGSGLGSLVFVLQALPNDQVLAGGSIYFTPGPILTNQIGRWNGSSWVPLGGGLIGAVNALTLGPSGELVAGVPSFAGATSVGRIARMALSCPATSTIQGAGCASSGGANALTAGAPWAGATFRSIATGLPGSAVVVVVSGTTSIPAMALDSVVPFAPAGCSLHVSPDLLQLALAVNGVAESTLQLPYSPVVLGAEMYHQMLPLELNASGSILEMSATNSLRLTIGGY